MKERGEPDAFTPSAPDILAWLKAQAMTCHYSGEKITPAKSEIDHRTPVAKGGTNEFSNLCLSSPAMNKAKGDMTEEEFRSLLNLLSTFEDGGKTVLMRLRMATHVYAR